MLPTNESDWWSDTDMEPSTEDLAAIEAEAPVIAAEVRLVDAEIAVVCAGRLRATELDWQRVRLAERDLVDAWCALYIAAWLASGSAVA